MDKPLSCVIAFTGTGPVLFNSQSLQIRLCGECFGELCPLDEDATEALMAGGHVVLGEPAGEGRGGQLLEIEQVEVSFGVLCGGVKIVHGVPCWRCPLPRQIGLVPAAMPRSDYRSGVARSHMRETCPLHYLKDTIQGRKVKENTPNIPGEVGLCGLGKMG